LTTLEAERSVLVRWQTRLQATNPRSDREQAELESIQDRLPSST
jgi:hypothetical protein